jgi:hypothetical protein
LVPPHYHRRNAAERAIRTFKEHFVAGLSSVDPTFLLHLWYRLLPQAEITLNILRTSRLHPQLSAAAHFHGLVDYNKTAFAPPGCKIIAHEKPGKRRTWAPHGKHGYSSGPAMHHYRCQNVYISSTVSERIMDTLKFFPHNYQIPQLSSTDRLIMAAKDMTDALQKPHPEVPFARIGDDTISALAELAAIFKLTLRQTTPPTLPAAPPKVTQRPCLAESSNPLLASPVPLPRQTRSQTTIHTHKTSPTRHYLRGWSRLGRSTHHLQGCPLALGDSLPATCPKTTSAEWTPPMWSSPSETTIGLSDTKQTPSSTPSPGKKWNTWHS